MFLPAGSWRKVLVIVLFNQIMIFILENGFLDFPHNPGLEWRNPVTDKIAIIGDIHNHFDLVDVATFTKSDYDLLLFVGDLSKVFIQRQTKRIAGMLAQLQKPALFIPGNHDVANVFQLLAEILAITWLAKLAGRGHVRHHQRLQQWLSPVVVGGYSTHTFQFHGDPFDVVVARPYALGGSEMSFAPFLQKQFGVYTEADSIRLLVQAIDETRTERLIFLAHNGPAGLGNQPDDIWGCDFDPKRGDFGDRDLTQAIVEARNREKKVIAVIAGHMHLRTKQGSNRPWRVQQDGILYINAARVPRIFDENGQTRHQHISLALQDVTVSVNEVMA